MFIFRKRTVTFACLADAAAATDFTVLNKFVTLWCSWLYLSLVKMYHFIQEIILIHFLVRTEFLFPFWIRKLFDFF